MGRARDAEPTAEPAFGVRLRAVIRGRLAGQDGIALVLTLIVMGVLTIGTAAVMTEVTSNEHHFGRDHQVNRALNIAEAGLNAGVNAAKALAGDRHLLAGGEWNHRQRLVVVHGDAGAGLDRIPTSTTGRSRPPASRPTATSRGS